jgi:maltose alpha-D-glucosyltransferase / alpha-amylase
MNARVKGRHFRTAHVSETAPESRCDGPLWYKDAIIYQLHVKSFFDSNNDGIGDFAGLISKLDYIRALGATAIWLLPFYCSPMLDDGYDISDYLKVNHDYGTMADVKRFIRKAHERGIRVIAELVINHTSDQHPWFQRARRAKPGSAMRDFYVWSETGKEYAGTRIIFLDTERSNWTWDPVAEAYYWHRFYSHQPDLNYDNPLVLQAMLGVMRFWFEIGVDGMRLGAIPYLVERDGTSNENLPETHLILKRIRAKLDARFTDRMLLAEANQWPEVSQDYFGDGDECHMAFHFPLMTRMYMAVGREDRFPITDIMRQTPAIPEKCQWVIFLRNHDELTLEMVTDNERDYLWEVYAADRRARLNLGIRRRLTPLLEGDRRRVELLNCLLLAMPGTPVIYYGDEIGMGDNFHLGDRDGVRTPMQWSPDRNGGFSGAADPATLVLPPIMDPLYGYEAVNVESQSRDPHSLLNWMRRILAVRRQHRALGRGSLRFLYPKNRKILAYLREYEGETILCVANLARSAQAVELDLSEYGGRIPIELNNGSPFPPIGQLTYLLTMSPYGFYWFLLATEGDWPSWHTPAPEPMPEFHTIVLRGSLQDALLGAVRPTLEHEVLRPYLGKRRWYSAKDQILQEVRLTYLAPFVEGDRECHICELETITSGGTATWLLPLAVIWDTERAAALATQLALSRVRRERRIGLLTDAFAVPAFAIELVRRMRLAQRIATSQGNICFVPTPGLVGQLEISDDAEINWISAEQSNSSLIIADQIMLKIFRRISGGKHPEAEMSRYLTAQGFTNSPPLLGEIVRRAPDGTTYSLAVAQSFVRNQGDAWSWLSDQLLMAQDDLAAAQPAIGAERDHRSDYEQLAATIGRRLGEMHAVFARPNDDPAFAPEIADDHALAVWRDRARALLESAFDTLMSHQWERGEDAERAGDLQKQRAALLAAMNDIPRVAASTLMTRIHGDFHLGQVLVASGDTYIIDFEGEPGRSLEERRAKASPLRDVAGLVRSLDYVAANLADRKNPRAGPMSSDRSHDLLDRFRTDATAAFQKSYRSATGKVVGIWNPRILELLLLEKAAYEINYEAANRPQWLPVPLAGMARLARRILGEEERDR